MEYIFSFTYIIFNLLSTIKILEFFTFAHIFTFSSEFYSCVLKYKSSSEAKLEVDDLGNGDSQAPTAAHLVGQIVAMTLPHEKNHSTGLQQNVAETCGPRQQSAMATRFPGMKHHILVFLNHRMVGPRSMPCSLRS